MRIRPLWIVLAVILLPPLLVIGCWRTLPTAEIAGDCDSVSHIAPKEDDAVAFSTALRSEILNNPGGPFQLHVAESELTSYVILETHGRQLADPQIHFLDDAVCFSGHIVGLGLLHPRFKIEAHPRVVSGDIQFDFQRVVVNGRLLPAWMRHLVQRITNESIRDASLPVRFDTVQLRDSEITITGERLPAPR